MSHPNCPPSKSIPRGKVRTCQDVHTYSCACVVRRYVDICKLAFDCACMQHVYYNTASEHALVIKVRNGSPLQDVGHQSQGIQSNEIEYTLGVCICTCACALCWRMGLDSTCVHNNYIVDSETSVIQHSL